MRESTGTVVVGRGDARENKRLRGGRKTGLAVGDSGSGFDGAVTGGSNTSAVCAGPMLLDVVPESPNQG